MASGSKRIVGTSVPDIDLNKRDETLSRRERREKEAISVPIQDRGVYDEQGRRRFHGAFTGGFSAGYYNTVGSKEGWRPKEWKSGKSNVQSITDFMDEEDLEDLAFGSSASSSFKLSSDFAATSASKTYSEETEKGNPIPSLFPLHLLSHSSDPIGYRLLRLMGWSDGRAVGPKRIQEEDGDLFTRGDTRVVVFSPKLNTFGLGFNAQSLHHASLNHSYRDTMAKRGRTIPMGSAEETYVSDDDPVYGSSSSHFVKEIDIRPVDEEEITLSLTRPPRSKSTNYKSEERKRYLDRRDERRKGLSEAKRVTGVLEGVKGKKGPIAGFVFSSLPPLTSPHFPSPPIPNSFDPVHRFHNVPSEVAIARDPSGDLTSKQRTHLLGEDSLDPTKRITTSETMEERWRLAVSTDGTNNFAAKIRETADDRVGDSNRATFPIPHYNHLDQSRDRPPERNHSQKTTIPGSTPPSRPLVPEAMSKRFVTTQTREEKQEDRAMSGEKESKEEAAKLGLFGTLTRSIIDWSPNSLLCKRMNIKNPARVSRPMIEKRAEHKADVGMPSTGLHPTLDASLDLSSPSFIASQAFDEGNGVSQTQIASFDDSNLPLPPPQRPPIDLFKSIFEDSDEDDDSEVEEKALTSSIPSSLVSPPATLIPPLSSQSSPLAPPVDILTSGHKPAAQMIASSFSPSKAAESFFERLASDIKSQHSNERKMSLDAHPRSSDPREGKFSPQSPTPLSQPATSFSATPLPPVTTDPYLQKHKTGNTDSMIFGPPLPPVDSLHTHERDRSKRDKRHKSDRVKVSKSKKRRRDSSDSSDDHRKSKHKKYKYK